MSGGGGEGSGLTGGYMPSFATPKKIQQQQQSFDVGIGVETPNRRGSGINLRNINDLGGPPSFSSRLLHRPPNPEPPKNSLIEIGTVPKSNLSNATSSPRLAVGGVGGGAGGFGGGFQNRKLSLGLSYGPIISSLDNQGRNSPKLLIIAAQ
jgi:hypothetical protein